MPPTTTKPPTDDPVKPTDEEMAAHAATKRAAEAPGLFVIVAQPREGGQIVELHSEETAAARLSMLTYASKQHRKEAEEADEPLPDGGGSHEINRRDIHVYRLSTTEVTDL